MKGFPPMTRYLVLVAALTTAAVSLTSAAALPADAQAPRVVSRTADGAPISLGSMAVVATPLR